MSNIVHTKGAFEFDHVACGVSDTEKGARWLAQQTGAEVMATEPEEGQWYWSHAMPLPDGAALEVIGPNPAHTGFHPIKQMLRQLDTPTPLFWHLGTKDFDGLCRTVKTAGAKVERMEHLDTDTAYGRRTYTRGIVGPGFRSTRPCVISWVNRPKGSAMDVPSQCEVLDFRLTSPRAPDLNRLFQTLDLNMRAVDGPECITIRLKTPKGDLTLSGAGPAFEGAGAVWQLLKLRLAYAFGR